MIALDTNILVRYLVEDDARQARLARELIEDRLTESEPGFISLPVLCEIVWALRHVYHRSRADVARAVGLLLQARQIKIEEQALVGRALQHEASDIADALIHEVGQAAGCVKTMTFDRSFARLNGVELLRS